MVLYLGSRTLAMTTGLLVHPFFEGQPFHGGNLDLHFGTVP